MLAGDESPGAAPPPPPGAPPPLVGGTDVDGVWRLAGNKSGAGEPPAGGEAAAAAGAREMRTTASAVASGPMSAEELARCVDVRELSEEGAAKAWVAAVLKEELPTDATLQEVRAHLLARNTRIHRELQPCESWRAGPLLWRAALPSCECGQPRHRAQLQGHVAPL